MEAGAAAADAGVRAEGTWPTLTTLALASCGACFPGASLRVGGGTAGMGGRSRQVHQAQSNAGRHDAERYVGL